jgi:hypothetical protein
MVRGRRKEIPARGPKGVLMEYFGRQVGQFFTLLFFAGAGYLLSSVSFDFIRDMRQLERVPRTSALGALPGEVNLSGRVESAGADLRAPRSGKPCVYFRYVQEREERNRDGDTRWVTEQDYHKIADFFLADESGRIFVRASNSAEFHAKHSYSNREGNKRYTEYRIDEGENVFIFGYVQKDDRAKSGFIVGFDHPGDYQALVSVKDEAEERSSKAAGSVIACALGLLCFSMAVVFACALVEVHSVLTYLGVVALAVTLGLFFFGTRMMRDDLRASHARFARHAEGALAATKEKLQEKGIAWDGDWNSLGDYEDAKYAALSFSERERLKRIRIDLARAASRNNRQRDAFPEFLFAPAWGVPREPAPILPPADLALAQQMEGQFVPARLNDWFAGIGALIGILAALGCAKWGFKLIKTKRCIENIPTAPTMGIACGLAEVCGETARKANDMVYWAPLSKAECVFYSYIEQEWVQGHKSGHWQTVYSTQKSAPFMIRDRDGELLVDPRGAEIIASKVESNSVGNRRMTERRLEVGTPIYALGTAVVEPTTMDRLMLAKGDGEMPFIISDKPENEVLFRKGRAGLLVLNLSLSAAVTSALLLFGASGAFAASDYLASALAAIVYMVILALIFHVNDIVFLQERVKRNWSNIDVSLKKRADLIPRLESVVKGSMTHERDLQTNLAAMRDAYQGGALLHPGMVEAFLKQETEVIGKFLGLTERYPRSEIGFADGAPHESPRGSRKRGLVHARGLQRSRQRLQQARHGLPGCRLGQVGASAPGSYLPARREAHPRGAQAGHPPGRREQARRSRRWRGSASRRRSQRSPDGPAAAFRPEPRRRLADGLGPD